MAAEKRRRPTAGKTDKAGASAAAASASSTWSSAGPWPYGVPQSVVCHDTSLPGEEGWPVGMRPLVGQYNDDEATVAYFAYLLNQEHAELVNPSSSGGDTVHGRSAFITERYQSALRMDAHARNVAREVQMQAYRSVADGESSLSDWGGIAIPGSARHESQASGHDVSASPPSDTRSQYRSRPLLGATSAALYISAEQEVGAPPKHRAAWRHALREDANAILNPDVVAQATEALKRPAFPDRMYPFPAAGGSECLRSMALAADYDDARAEELSLHEQHIRCLRDMQAAVSIPLPRHDAGAT